MSVDQIQKVYDRDGVVRVKQFLAFDVLKTLRREIESYIRDIAPGLEPGEVTFEADGKTARNLWRMEKHSAFFRSVAAKPEILNLVRELLHGEPVNLGVETFNKPARIGSAVPPHQDNAYFCQSPPDVLTVWIAMDPVTDANGPVFYERGSHQLGLLPHRASGVKGNSIGLAAPFHFSNRMTGLLDPGDALIRHCQTIHYSEPNQTDSPRCGFLSVYRAAHTQTDPLMKAAYEKARALVS